MKQEQTEVRAYEAPAIEVMEVEVEKGFAASSEENPAYTPWGDEETW